jgi:hypothetical protein
MVSYCRVSFDRSLQEMDIRGKPADCKRQRICQDFVEVYKNTMGKFKLHGFISNVCQLDVLALKGTPDPAYIFTSSRLYSPFCSSHPSLLTHFNHRINDLLL